jgi:hypothetical protein
MVFGLVSRAAPSVRIFILKKNHDFGQETVKFWMLYQALTTMNPAMNPDPGKEIMECRRVTRLPAGVPG